MNVFTPLLTPMMMINDDDDNDDDDFCPPQLRPVRSTTDGCCRLAT